MPAQTQAQRSERTKRGHALLVEWFVNMLEVNVKNWSMVAGALSLVMSLQAVACTQPVDDEKTGSAEAPLTASATVGGQLVSVPVVDSEAFERGKAQIKAQSQVGDAETWALTQDGRRVVILEQPEESGNRVSARGYIEDASGLRTPFELKNVSANLNASSTGGIQPRFWGLLVVIVIIIVVVIIVAPPIVNSVMCSNRSTPACLCQKAIPEPTSCTISGGTKEGGVEACATIDKVETTCVCRPTDPASGVDCSALSN